MKCNTDSTNRLQFNTVADDYESVRPTYPTDVFDRIVQYSCLTEGFNVLEIGCGTGQATLPMARLGVQLLAIDPGDHLLELARAKLMPYPKVAFLNCFFEDAQLPPKSFDLVISATAFHWIPPHIAYPKTSELLKPGATLALFWNMMPTFDGKIGDHLRILCDQYVPGLGDSSFGKGSIVTSDEGIEELGASGLFTNIERNWFKWSIRLSGGDFVKLLFTFGNFRALPSERGAQLSKAIQDWVQADLGNVIECHYETVLHLCKRRC